LEAVTRSVARPLGSPWFAGRFANLFAVIAGGLLFVKADIRPDFPNWLYRDIIRAKHRIERLGMRRRNFMTVLAGAAAYPLSVGAQQKAMPVVGWLSIGSPASDKDFRLVGFHEGLNEAGYGEGRNVAMEYRWAEGQYNRLPVLASDLVSNHVTIIMAVGGTPSALAAKAATSTIPIVFNLGIDPVQSGLVASLNRPGGNITGVVVLTTELTAKRLELLHQSAPTAARVGLMVNRTSPANDPETISAQGAARVLGLQAHVVQVGNPNEIKAAFEMLVERNVGALVVSADPLFINQCDQVVALAAQHALPAIYQWREFTTAGGLMSYGSDLTKNYRQAGVYAGKILKGAKPADLPVQQVVKLELAINLKTAKSLGLTIPLSILARADEVIE
jgi:putative ABC transport system substrate-binding protein